MQHRFSRSGPGVQSPESSLDFYRTLRAASLGTAVILSLGCGRACAEESAPVDAATKGLTVRAACPNLLKVLSESSYPRDAIARHLHAGEAVIEFVVDDGRAGQITIISESDPAFGAAAIASVAKLECSSFEQPIRFRVPVRFNRD